MRINDFHNILELVKQDVLHSEAEYLKILTDSFAPQNSCDNYLRLINSAYDRDFESLKIYKQERNFNYLLQSLNINDVIEAVERGRIIMENCAKNSAIKEYKGYKFYDENPSLSIHEIVGGILKECGLMN